MAKLFQMFRKKQEAVQPPAQVFQAQPVAPVAPQVLPPSPVVPQPTPSSGVAQAPAQLKVQQYPGTNNWGDWRDVKPGESPEEYFARTGLAGYGATQEQLEKESAERNKNFGTDPATGKPVQAKGPLVLSALTDDDCAYLVAMGEYMTFDPRNLTSGDFFGAVSARLGIDTFPNMGAARFDPIGFEQSGKVSHDVIDLVKKMAMGDPSTYGLYPVFGDQTRESTIAGMKKAWNRVHTGGTAWVSGRPVQRESYNLIP